MFETLVWATLFLCLGTGLVAYLTFKDVFHPLIYIPAFCAFIYGYMPLSLLHNLELYSYISPEQGEFCQIVIFLGLTAMFAGCFFGSLVNVKVPAYRPQPDPVMLTKGAYVFGAIGMLCWAATIRGAGGFQGAYGEGGGAGWSDIGYIRDAAALLIVAISLLLSAEVNSLGKSVFRNVAVLGLAAPWVIQGLLGARRGPTFMIVVTLVMGWYLGRKKRPPLVLVLGGGALLGMLMLFLVANRSKIHLGAKLDNLDVDLTEPTQLGAQNEYIFGVGCMITVNYTHGYWWGWRYLSQIVVRPIPQQIWPNKYTDTGLLALTRNAGVAVGNDLMNVMGWRQIPGSAAAMVADLWVEFYWFCIPVMGGIGFLYGLIWKKAMKLGGVWVVQFLIITLLSIYMVTQSGEAVIFRLVLLSVPVRFWWARALRSNKNVGALPQQLPYPA